MDGRAPPRQCDRGGESISTVRASRHRLALALVAAPLGAALAGYPVLHAGRLVPLVEVLAGLALASTAMALAGRSRFVAPVLVCIGVEFLIVDLVAGSGFALTLLYAAGLLVLAELLYWRSSLAGPVAVQSATLVRHAAAIAAATVVGAAATLAALAAEAIGESERIPSSAAGVAAACILLGSVLACLRRFAIVAPGDEARLNRARSRR